MGSIILTVTGINSAADLRLDQAADHPREMCRRIINLFSGLANGAYSGTILANSSSSAAVQAGATSTFTAVVATDTVVINGVSFTCVNSGATGDQFNKGASETASATNAAAAINASVTAKVAGYVTASSSGAVLTITAVQPGVSGNLFTLAETGGHQTLSGAAFTGGTGGNAIPVTYNLA